MYWSASEFACGTFEALGIPCGEDQLGSLSPCQSGRFEPDAGATPDHNDDLTKEFRSRWILEVIVVVNLPTSAHRQ
jgi:hypothetical protein